MVRHFSRRLILAVAFVSGIVASSISLGQSIVIDKVVAIVDNDPIVMSEYVSRHRQERLDGGRVKAFDGAINRKVLDSLIDEKIQANRARRRGITVTEQEIDSAVQFIAQQNNIKPEALIVQLERDGFTYQQFRDSLERQQLIRKLIDVVANARVVVSDEEVENYLRANNDIVASDESYDVSHLFIVKKDKTAEQVAKDKENLVFIRRTIIAGQPFEDAVASYSDESAKQDGGRLGWRTRDQLPDIFVEALQEMDSETDNISEILESANGLHLLKLHGKRGSGKLVQQQKIQHILIQPDESNTAAEALEIIKGLYKQIQDGESFEKIARIHSYDSQSRNDGGSLGWVNPGALVPAFEEVATSLKLNEVSGPVRTNFGYHLIRVLDRREADVTDEIASNRARQAILRRKAQDIYGNWLKVVRNQSFIEYIQ